MIARLLKSQQCVPQVQKVQVSFGARILAGQEVFRNLRSPFELRPEPALPCRVLLGRRGAYGEEGQTHEQQEWRVLLGQDTAEPVRKQRALNSWQGIPATLLGCQGLAASTSAMSRDAAAGHQYRHADDSPQPSESEIAPRSVFLESWRGFTNLLTRGLRELLFMASEHDPRMKDRLLPRVIWMLGVRYDLGTLAADGNATEDEPEAGNGMQEFRRDMQSRLWFTYRSGLDPIAGVLSVAVSWPCSAPGACAPGCSLPLLV